MAGETAFKAKLMCVTGQFLIKKTNGMAVVDLSTLSEKFREDCRRTAGLVKTLPENDHSLEDALRYRYGETIGDILVPIAKSTLIKLVICIFNYRTGLFKRVKRNYNDCNEINTWTKY